MLLLQKFVFENFVLLVLARVVIARDSNYIMLNVVFLLVLVDVIDDLYMYVDMPPKIEKI